MAVVYHKQLAEKIENRTAVFGVNGLGYVGLPLSLRFSEIGFKVIGFDLDESKHRAIENSESYITYISSAATARAVEVGLTSTSDYSKASECDVILVCLPTPLDSFREPDLSFIVSSFREISPYLCKGKMIGLESTTYPGTTSEILG